MTSCTDSNQSAPKQSGASGLIMEVVIPVHSKGTSTSATSTPSPPPTTAAASSSAAEDTGISDDDSDMPRIRKRRTVTKKAIVISDDEDDEDDAAPRKKPMPVKNGRRLKGKASASSSSDYEDQSAEDTASDSASISAEASSDDDEPKRNSKTKSKKAPAKSKTASKKFSKLSATSTEGSDDSMDVDEPVIPKTAKAVAKKRKADEDGKQPAKKQKRREETDPWKLESSGVKRDWTQMQAPPLEMFHFSRVVVDEYTYLDGKTHSIVTRQTGDRRWVLSGTVSQVCLLNQPSY